MTREDVLAMEPGRELDALVAEKAMGWEVERNHWLSHTCRIRTWEQTSYPGFQPSTDISAAWEVVEKMKPQMFGMREWPHNDGYNFYETWFMDSETGRCSTVRIKSAPEAICKAALLAVMDA